MRVTNCASTPMRSWLNDELVVTQPGQIIEVEDSLGKSMIASGFYNEVREEKQEKKRPKRGE